MATLTEHLGRIREKPHHEKKNLAFGLALGITAVVAVLWLGVSVSSGRFAIQGSNFAASTAGAPVDVVSDTPNANGQLAGVGAVAPAPDSGAARIQIVDAPAPTPAAAAPDTRTVIPF